MEFLIELLLQFFGELLLQLFLEILVEAGLHSVAEPLRRKPNPWFAAAGYALLGGIGGALSLLVFPTLFMPTPIGRLASLILTPIAAGLAMTLVGAWRLRRNQSLVRLDRFAYGYLFALAMALVRYFYGH